MRKLRSSTIVTHGLLLVCILVFCLEHFWQPPELAKGISVSPSSPVVKALLFDDPRAHELELTLIETYGLKGLNPAYPLSARGEALRDEVRITPYWGGAYPATVEALTGRTQTPPTSIQPHLMCERIREGQVWRLFTPCLLHGNLIHIVFNMTWLIGLGVVIEQKIRALRYLVLIGIVGIVSNCAEYLMSGPFFLGFSGVVCGMIGFIAARQRVAPWERYTLHKTAYSSLLFFIFALVAISVISFITEIYLATSFSIGFANTSHVSGLFTGLLVGRLRWFKEQQTT
jgi:GlpG protein